MTGAGTLKTHYSGQTPRRGRQSTAGQNNILYKVIMIFNLIMTILSTLLRQPPREMAQPAFGGWRWFLYAVCISEFFLVAVVCLFISCIVEFFSWSEEMPTSSKCSRMIQTIFVNFILLLAGVAYLVGDNIRMLAQDFDTELFGDSKLQARDFRSYAVAFSLCLMVISRLEPYIASTIADYRKPQSIMTLTVKFENPSDTVNLKFWQKGVAYTLSIPSGYYKMWKLGTTLKLSFKDIRKKQNLDSEAESNTFNASPATSSMSLRDSTAWEQKPPASPTWTVILQDELEQTYIEILYFGNIPGPVFVEESTILTVRVIKSKIPNQLILKGHSPKITVADNLCTWSMEFQAALEKRKSQVKGNSESQACEPQGSLPREGESQGNSQTDESPGNSKSTKPTYPPPSHSGTSIMKYSKISSAGLLWAYASLVDYALIADAFYTTILDEIKQNYAECFNSSLNAATYTYSEFDLKTKISLSILLLISISWAVVILWVAACFCCCHNYQKLFHLEDFEAILKMMYAKVTVFVRRVKLKFEVDVSPYMQKILDREKRMDFFCCFVKEHMMLLIIASSVCLGIFCCIPPIITLYLFLHGVVLILVGLTIFKMVGSFPFLKCGDLLQFYVIPCCFGSNCCSQDCKFQAVHFSVHALMIFLILIYLPVYLIGDNSWPWECYTDKWHILRFLFLLSAFLISLPFTGLSLMGKVYNWLDGQVNKKDLYKVGI
jgi:hypothetical protein